MHFRGLGILVEPNVKQGGLAAGVSRVRWKFEFIENKKPKLPPRFPTRGSIVISDAAERRTRPRRERVLRDVPGTLTQGRPIPYIPGCSWESATYISRDQ